MRIVIENTVCLNAGDAAIAIAIIRILQRSFGQETRFDIFDSDPQIAERYYPDLRFHPLTAGLVRGKPMSMPLLSDRNMRRVNRNLRRIRTWSFGRLTRSVARGSIPPAAPFLDRRVIDNMRIYADADLVVSTGGTYLVEHYDFSERLAEFEKDFELGKPLVLFTQSLGPYSKPDVIARMKAVASRARLILLRDEKSRQNLLEIGVGPERLHVVSDSVFALANGPALRRPYSAPPGRPMRVAVSVRDWAHFDGLTPEAGMERFTRSVADAVTALVRDKNCEVVFLSTCQGIPEYRYDDSKVASAIASGLPEDVRARVSVDQAFHTPEALMEKVAGFDFVIATRMHMAILSLCSGVSVLPISYEFKMTELFRGLGQDQWVSDISHMDPEVFSAKALRFSEHLADFHAAAMPEIDKQYRSALSAGDLVAEALGLPSPAEADQAGIAQ